MKGIKKSQSILRQMANLHIKLFIVIFFFVSPVYAQDFLHESTAPVAVHEKKTSAVSFPTQRYIPAAVSDKDQEVSASLSSTTSYILFIPREQSEDPYFKKALQYTLPITCKDSKVEMQEVFHHTEGTDALDILIYNAKDTSQSAAAARFSKIRIPWDPSYDPSEGQETSDARFQDLIRILDPECLPARFKFVYVGSKRYNEIKYGSKAFEP